MNGDMNKTTKWDFFMIINGNMNGDMNPPTKYDKYGDGSNSWYLVNPKIAGIYGCSSHKNVSIGIDSWPIPISNGNTIWDIPIWMGY